MGYYRTNYKSAGVYLTWRSRNQEFPFGHSPVISTAGRDLVGLGFLPRQKISRSAPNDSPVNFLIVLFRIFGVTD
uniref:Uncharacterized protein n=1 Tax=Candidatus Kentrum sp. TUN TaxID=2126343 RepID=A0A451APW3_9GAMM|nr:MAG: hypothetical protein BECKTUN1418F_GA0071002_11823 [Candidatus Kentron sp. TUN]VFK68063.1 MAG: hypothetical protein BECKTUN1418E_GA0071001_11773 [Candidatus Kentron sp. TUN]